LDGLSGSPVFIHEEIGLKMKGAPARGLVTRGLVKLLGVFQGSWDGAPGEILARDRNFRGNVRIPVGMGLVVPGDKIVQLIKDHSRLKKVGTSAGLRIAPIVPLGPILPSLRLRTQSPEIFLRQAMTLIPITERISCVL
jgi:hypothetical protein